MKQKMQELQSQRDLSSNLHPITACSLTWGTSLTPGPQVPGLQNSNFTFIWELLDERIKYLYSLIHNEPFGYFPPFDFYVVIYRVTLTLFQFFFLISQYVENPIIKEPNFF